MRGHHDISLKDFFYPSPFVVESEGGGVKFFLWYGWGIGGGPIP